MAILVGRLGIGRDESRPYGGVFGGEQRVVIFAPPPTRQIFPIRDAVGAQFIAPLLVREASDTAGLMRGDRSTNGVSLHNSIRRFGYSPYGSADTWRNWAR